MLDLAGLAPGQVLLDLGSGDGRILVMAALSYGARCQGVEIDPVRFAFSRLLVRLFKLTDRIEIAWGDMYNFNLSRADVIVLHLSRGANDGLRQALAGEVGRGATIVSLTFPIEGWSETLYDPQERVYVYRTTSRADLDPVNAEALA